MLQPVVSLSLSNRFSVRQIFVMDMFSCVRSLCVDLHRFGHGSHRESWVPLERHYCFDFWDARPDFCYSGSPFPHFHFGSSSSGGLQATRRSRLVQSSLPAVGRFVALLLRRLVAPGRGDSLASCTATPCCSVRVDILLVSGVDFCWCSRLRLSVIPRFPSRRFSHHPSCVDSQLLIFVSQLFLGFLELSFSHPFFYCFFALIHVCTCGSVLFFLLGMRIAPLQYTRSGCVTSICILFFRFCFVLSGSCFR